MLSFSFGVVMERCGSGGMLQTCFVQARVNIECIGIFLLKSLAVLLIIWRDGRGEGGCTNDFKMFLVQSVYFIDPGTK